MINYIAYILAWKCILNLIAKKVWGMFCVVIIKSASFTGAGVQFYPIFL